MAILPNHLKKELIAIPPKSLTRTKIADLFGYTTTLGGFDVKPPKFNPRDKVHLEPKEYINVEAVDTNVGIILFNKLMVEGKLEDIVPNRFYNEVVTKKKFSKLSQMVGDALRTGKIDIEPTVAQFLTDYEFWGLSLVAIFSPSYTMGMIKPNPTLVKKTKDAIQNSDLQRVEDMIKTENELVKVAHQVTQREPGKTLFDSGSRGSFENDFKNMAVFIGPVENPVTGEYDFMTSNYMSGLKKEDLVGAGNIIINAEYPKAIGTARGGYLTKQFYSVFQMITLGPKGSDCGSQVGLRVHLTEDNIHYFIDQYVITTKGPLQITDDNASKFLNKWAMIRSPMFCLSDKICNICAGERYYIMDINAIGLTSVNMSNNLMQKNLKLRHSMKMQVDQVKPDKLLLE